MIKVKDSKVVQTKLPVNGRLSDGRTVSGYHKLPEDILKAEGWLPEVIKEPDYDPATQQLKFDHYEILKTQVNVHYIAEPIPEPEPDPVVELTRRVTKLESDVSTLTAKKSV